MRKLILFVTAVLVSAGALAETEKIDTTMYAMITEQPTQITLPNGSVVAAGWENSARLIAADGEESVQYCQGDGVTETDGMPDSAQSCSIAAIFCGSGSGPLARVHPVSGV